MWDPATPLQEPFRLGEDNGEMHKRAHHASRDVYKKDEHPEANWLPSNGSIGHGVTSHQIEGSSHETEGQKGTGSRTMPLVDQDGPDEMEQARQVDDPSSLDTTSGKTPGQNRRRSSGNSATALSSLVQPLRG